MWLLTFKESSEPNVLQILSRVKSKSTTHSAISIALFRHSEVGSIFVLYTFVDAIVILLNPADIQVRENGYCVLSLTLKTICECRQFL